MVASAASRPEGVAQATAKSWLDVPADHPFGPANLPYGVFSTARSDPRVGVRIGDLVVDASAVAARGGDPGAGTGTDLAAAWRQPRLNPFLELGRPAWAVARAWLVEVLGDPVHRRGVEPHLIPIEECTMHLPIEVADYVDFYASEHHATNVGRIFRPGSEPLTPNWRHLPIGYHGRSGTVVVSGTDIVRPCGQRKGSDDTAPVFGPSVRLDIEAELGFVVGGATRMGSPISVDRADEHIFGVVLLNDWSARDIQAWEYVPLGPFLGKSFATSISPWVVTMDALATARVGLPDQDPEPLPYLRSRQGDGEDTGDGAGSVYGLDISYQIEWNGTVVARPEFREMYWAHPQMLAHLTANGASVRSGDLFGSGTISGPEPQSRGSFLELTWSGRDPITLADGSRRTFLVDYDRVTLRAHAPGPGGAVIGLGECTGRVLPAVVSAS